MPPSAMKADSPVILSEAGWVGVKRKNLKVRKPWHRPCFTYLEILSLHARPPTSLRMTGIRRSYRPDLGLRWAINEPA
jgi:hypothetical protein